MTNQPVPFCTFCGLLCSIDALHQQHAIFSCPRVQSYFSLDPQPSQTTDGNVQSIAEQVHQLLSKARRPLLWLDGADVLTTRAAVDLAWKHRAAIHVPKSTGGQIVHRLVCSDGWLGTTLADMSEHAQLVITLGTSWITQMPLLVHRWFKAPLPGDQSQPRPADSRQWWHIGSQLAAMEQLGSQLASSAATAMPDRWFQWPQSEWYLRMTECVRLLGNAQHQSAHGTVHTETQASATSTDEELLANAICNSVNTTIVWEISEFKRPEDEMIVYRLLNLARLRNQFARCSLLALNADAGRETAHETLLWLTGCDGVAVPDGDKWKGSLGMVGSNDSDWHNDYDVIVLVRNTPSLSPLPDIGWHMALCDPGSIGLSPTTLKTVPVAMAGVQVPAFLLRGDRGTLQFVPPNLALWPSRPMDLDQAWISATEVLRLAANMARTDRSSHKQLLSFDAKGSSSFRHPSTGKEPHA